MNIQFGTGVLYGVPVAGNLPTNPTPYKFGILQEASIEFKGDLKKLFGQRQFPVSKARGKIDVTGKAKIAAYDPNMVNQLFFAQTSTGGIQMIADNESQVIPGTPYQVTVTNVAGVPITDYGVIFGSGAKVGQQLTRVASSPATGQYSVNTATGVYTFAAADTTLTVLISYTYASGSRGSTITLANQLQGYAPELQMLFYNLFRSKLLAIQLNNVTLGTFTFPSKQEDYWMSDIDFEACTDDSDTLGKIFADLS